MNRSKSKRRQSIHAEADENKVKKSKKIDDLDRDNLLHSCLQKSGLILRAGDESNELSVSKIAFQKKLGATLKNHSGDLLQNVDTFLQELGEYFEEPKRFNKSLMPCSRSNDNENLTTVPDSAVRLLLGVDVIQSPLMVLLLDKLLVYWGEEDDYIFHQKQMVYIPRLLLSQFRFLDRIVDGKELTSKLLSVLSNVSLEVQKEILACIPDIVEDSEHGEVALKLGEELSSNKDLTCAIIDALTYLNISEDQVSQVRTSVVEMLKTFSVNDLPIVVNFLLESLTAQDALEIVNEIRSNVSFVTSSRLSAEELEKVNSSTKLTVDALKGRMQFQRCVAEAWIKALDSAQTAQTLDMFALLILHWLNHRKAVESLIRNKIRAGLLTEMLLVAFFQSHTQIVRDYFPSVLSLAQTLMRSLEPKVGLIGSTLYKLAFTHFDSYCKQEIVASLLTHIGSGQSSEIDASLNILTGLVKDQLKEMTRFAVFIKGALDYLDHNNLSILHIKKLYLMLAELAFKQSQEGNYFQDELHIIIRKQLTSTNTKYKRMGVMGAISIIQAVAGNNEKNERKLGEDQFKQVVDLLQLMRSSCVRDAEMTALFLDSLASTLASQRLCGSIETWIADNMTETFEETFVCDLDELEELQKKSCVPVERLFNLNNESQSTIFINLVPLVEQTVGKTTLSQSESNPLVLAPIFRLITQCERLQSDNDMENIDALLGCPVLMVKSDISEGLSAMYVKERDIVCASLFFCINWMREVVNSFGGMTNAEMKGKVIQRLRHITELNSLLSDCLAQHSIFQPPAAIFELEAAALAVKPVTSATSADKKGKGGGGKGKKGKKQTKSGATIDETLAGSTQGDEEEEEVNATSTQASIDTALSGGKKGNTGGKQSNSPVDLSTYRPFFRELDISVFAILSSGLVRRWSNTSPGADTNGANTSEDKDLRLDLPELVFLLEDLVLKLKHKLLLAQTTGRGRPAGFGAGKGDDARKAGFSNIDQISAAKVAKQAVTLFPVLADFLEEICTFYQTQEQNEEEEEDLDAVPLVSAEDLRRMSLCFHLLLQCIHSVLSWEGLRHEENQEMLADVLSVAVRRLRPSQGKNSYIPQQEKIECTFQYFSNLVTSTPDLKTGVTLTKILKTLVELSTEESIKEKLAQHAKAFLCREWKSSDGELLRGANHSADLQLILQMYITSSSAPLETLEVLASQSLASMVNVSKKGHAEEIASLNRWTFPIFYKVLLTELISNMKRMKACKKSDSMEVLEERLVLWGYAVKILYVAVSLTKVFSARGNLSNVLKFGRQFVELFLRLGMPLMDITFRRRHAQVEKLLRYVQQSTRLLHHLCGHSKINKDVGLTNQVPLLKRALESFVYRVKVMLALNDCQDAFWMGNLKNRNLQGEEILTQVSVASSGQTTAGGDDDEEEEEEEENNEGDNDENEDSEVEMEENEEAPQTSKGDSGSYSEIF